MKTLTFKVPVYIVSYKGQPIQVLPSGDEGYENKQFAIPVDETTTAAVRSFCAKTWGEDRADKCMELNFPVRNSFDFPEFGSLPYYWFNGEIRHLSGEYGNAKVQYIELEIPITQKLVK